jgi:formylglycine-generating enzyme required for sulfatase activity
MHRKIVLSVVFFVFFVSFAGAGGKGSKDPTTGMEFIFVKGGCYDMGDTFGDGESDEKPVHKVCISDFYIGQYEVTQGQWKTIMGSNLSDFSFCGDTCPVEMISWNDTQEFIQKLNSKTGKSYRLPTEAEWEYAARSGGKKEKYAGTSSDSELSSYAWYNFNSDNETHPVGKKKPNGIGIYDMSGNVYEWCQDWFSSDYYKNKPRNNPQGPSSDSKRVFRGGSWLNEPQLLRASDRNDDDPSIRHRRIGFRLVRTP